MNLSYTARLLCLLIVSSGLTAVAVECALAAAASWMEPRLRGMNARRHERALFVLQVLPLAAGLVFALAFCLPQYLLYEPNSTPEAVSGWCLLLMAAAFAWFGTAAFRGLRLVLRTMHFVRACRRTGVASEETPASGRIPVLTLEQPDRIIALVGLLRPAILISRDVRASLSRHSLDVALAHERAHAAQRDNWKLLVLLLLPRLPLRASRAWMRQWQETAEWAADEAAVSGSRTRALLLAQTLVTVARRGPMPATPPIRTALTCEEARLAVRVERLVSPAARTPRASRAMRAVLLAAGALAIAAAVAAMQSPWIYQIGEHILHLG